jgi:hypothetical protein
MWVEWRLISIRLQIVLISTQGRSTVCAEYSTGVEIFFAPPDGPPRWRGQIEAHFDLFGDSVNLDACTICAERAIGSKIVLSAPDGTPRWRGVKWKLVLVRLEIVLILAQDRCMFVPNVPWALKSFWAHPIELLGNVGQVEAHFGTFHDSVNLDARLVHGFHWTWNRLRNHFGRTQWNS